MLIFPLSFPKLTNFNKCQGISDSTYIIQEKHASLPPNLFKISKYTYKSWDMIQKSQLATLPLKLLTTLHHKLTLQLLAGFFFLSFSLPRILT